MAEASPAEGKRGTGRGRGRGRGRSRPPAGGGPVKIGRPKKTQGSRMIWSFEERQRLLEGVKRYSPDDMDNLCRMVQSRSRKEIEDYMKGLKGGYNMKHKVTERVQLRWAPLESWLDLLTELVHYEQEDLSQQLAKVFSITSNLGDLPEQTDSSALVPDYRKLYRYIAAVLDDAPDLPELTPLECAVVLDLLHNIGDTMRMSETTLQRKVMCWKYKMLNHKYDFGCLKINLDRCRKAFTNDFSDLQSDQSPKVKLSRLASSFTDEGNTSSDAVDLTSPTRPSAAPTLDRPVTPPPPSAAGAKGHVPSTSGDFVGVQAETASSLLSALADLAASSQKQPSSTSVAQSSSASASQSSSSSAVTSRTSLSAKSSTSQALSSSSSSSRPASSSALTSHNLLNASSSGQISSSSSSSTSASQVGNLCSSSVNDLSASPDKQMPDLHSQTLSSGSKESESAAVTLSKTNASNAEPATDAASDVDDDSLVERTPTKKRKGGKPGRPKVHEWRRPLDKPRLYSMNPFCVPVRLLRFRPFLQEQKSLQGRVVQGAARERGPPAARADSPPRQDEARPAHALQRTAAGALPAFVRRTTTTTTKQVTPVPGRRAASTVTMSATGAGNGAGENETDASLSAEIQQVVAPAQPAACGVATSGSTGSRQVESPALENDGAGNKRPLTPTDSAALEIQKKMRVIAPMPTAGPPKDKALTIKNAQGVIEPGQKYRLVQLPGGQLALKLVKEVPFVSPLRAPVAGRAISVGTSDDEKRLKLEDWRATVNPQYKRSTSYVFKSSTTFGGGSHISEDTKEKMKAIVKRRFSSGSGGGFQRRPSAGAAPAPGAGPPSANCSSPAERSDSRTSSAPSPSAQGECPEDFEARPAKARKTSSRCPESDSPALTFTKTQRTYSRTTAKSSAPASTTCPTKSKARHLPETTDPARQNGPKSNPPKTLQGKRNQANLQKESGNLASVRPGEDLSGSSGAERLNLSTESERNAGNGRTATTKPVRQTSADLLAKGGKQQGNSKAGPELKRIKDRQGNIIEMTSI